jgi:hypothetical protein
MNENSLSKSVFENDFRTKLGISNVKEEFGWDFFEYLIAESSKGSQKIFFEKRIKDGMWIEIVSE